MYIRYYRDPNLPIFEIKNCDLGMHAERKHVHEEFSVGLITGGSSVINDGSRDYSVGRGSLVLIPAQLVHKCSPEDLTKWRFKMLYLEAKWVRALIAPIDKGRFIAVKQLDPPDYRDALRLFRTLQASRSGLEKEQLLMEALRHFCDFKNYYYIQSAPRSSEIHAAGLARDYLHQHFLEKIGLDDLVRVSGLSKYHLVRIFQQLYQTSPHAYQTMLRINYAKQELKEKLDCPIATIAQNAGFFDQSHFIKTFKLYHGTTPVDYRATV